MGNPVGLAIAVKRQGAPGHGQPLKLLIVEMAELLRVGTATMAVTLIRSLMPEYCGFATLI